MVRPRQSRRCPDTTTRWRYAASSGGAGGSELQRLGLAEEAIRLSRMLHRLLPGEDEVGGLLALILLTHARHAARADAGGALVPLAEQDRGRWDRAAISEGVGLVTGALASGPAAGLELLAEVEGDDRLTAGHRLPAVRGHLLELAGDAAGAADAYETAVQHTTSRPERDYLQRRPIAARAAAAIRRTAPPA